MSHHTTIDAMLDHRSIRRYKKEMPDEETVRTIVRAGQQAPFAYQLCSVLLSRDAKKNMFNAPLLFTFCVDAHKFELIMKKRGWMTFMNDLTILLFGIEDASYMAQNMVVAARSLGLGSCFIGFPLTNPEGIAKKYKLPKRVYPIVQLAMGYPAEEPPTRPRYPMDFVLFENEYPKLEDKTITKAMKVMDDGYLAQGYYKKANVMIPLQGKRKEKYTFKNYSWTEHISRKLGLWHGELEKQLVALERRGFKIREDRKSVV
jgi:nitroreductase